MLGYQPGKLQFIFSYFQALNTLRQLELLTLCPWSPPVGWVPGLMRDRVHTTSLTQCPMDPSYTESEEFAIEELSGSNFMVAKCCCWLFFFFFFFFLHMRYKSLVDSKYRKVSYFLPSLCCLLGQPIIWEGVIFIKLRDSKRNILSHIIRYIRGLEVGSSGNIFLCNSLKKTLSILTMYYRYQTVKVSQ